jgi:hypothetical protein
MTQLAIKEREPATAEPSSAFTSFILAQLNCAALRSKIITNQIETATVALSGGLISAEQAILILAECRLEIGAE